jgi:hypothetical protein
MMSDTRSRYAYRMHFSFAHVLVVAALASSILLVMREERLFPLIALAASAIEALIVFNLISLSSSKIRVDVILPAALLVAGGIAWARTSAKASVTAATIVTLVGATQLLRVLE